jgi:hypothetical protein
METSDIHIKITDPLQARWEILATVFSCYHAKPLSPFTFEIVRINGWKITFSND